MAMHNEPHLKKAVVGGWLCIDPLSWKTQFSTAKATEGSAEPQRTQKGRKENQQLNPVFRYKHQPPKR
jgi:hypothetical protein